ncbi:conserved membrane hypothetical protein [Burkholderiales bacterium 8X]|nr:conserved membrane hypothetical protein [Burkholderiales bacterium 8X]
MCIAEAEVSSSCRLHLGTMIANDTLTERIAPAPAQAHMLRFTRWGAILLGVALSGFFDGILLHQVLQWHHLLSGIEDPEVQRIDRLILADGLFHVLMYLIAAAGLWLLWRGRAALSGFVLGQRVPAWMLLGFGLWNLVDVVGFHWLAGIHRLRMDSPRPWLWDTLWLVAFGLLPMVAAARWLRRREVAPPSASAASRKKRSRAGAAAWAAIAVLVASAGFVSGRPPADVSTMLVFYPPGVPGATILRGIEAVDARILWVNASGTVWALDLPPGASTDGLSRQGAWFSSRFAGLASCAAWTRAKPPSASRHPAIAPLAYVHAAQPWAS